MEEEIQKLNKKDYKKIVIIIFLILLIIIGISFNSVIRQNYSYKSQLNFLSKTNEEFNNANKNKGLEIEICNSLINEDAKKKCYFAYAIENKNADTCFGMVDLTKKYKTGDSSTYLYPENICGKELFQIMANEEFCKQVEEIASKTPMIIDSCYREIIPKTYKIGKGTVLTNEIKKLLDSGEQIIEIKLLSNIKYPKYVHNNQVEKFFQLGNFQFALINKNNGLKYISKATGFSGVIYKEKNNEDWKIFFEIIDKDDSGNNPIYLWDEGNEIYILMVQCCGAGSGEGTAKTIKSNNGGKSWNIDKCFYHYTGYHQYISDGSYLPKDCISNGKCNGFMIKEYYYNPNIMKFENKVFDYKTDENKYYIVEECSDIVL